MKGECGFLCTSLHFETEKFIFTEKTPQSENYYKGILKKHGGFTHSYHPESSIYNCPLNYSIEGDFISQEHIDFTVQCLGFLLGTKLVSKKFSYIGNTNIKPYHIGFINFNKEEYLLMVDKVIDFYVNNFNESNKIKIIENAIFLLFLADVKFFLFEKFFILYSAIDSCYKYYEKGHTSAMELLKYLCNRASIDTEKYNKTLLFIKKTRNNMIHEGTFLGSLFAHRGNREEMDTYKKENVSIFLQDFLVRLIFSMLEIKVEGFLNPGSLDQTSLRLIHT